MNLFFESLRVHRSRGAYALTAITVQPSQLALRRFGVDWQREYRRCGGFRALWGLWNSASQGRRWGIGDKVRRSELLVDLAITCYLGPVSSRCYPRYPHAAAREEIIEILNKRTRIYVAATKLKCDISNGVLLQHLGRTRQYVQFVSFYV